MSSMMIVALFPLISLIFMGYMLKRMAFIHEGFWGGAEKLNYYVLFPVMLFMNLAFAKIDVQAIQSILWVVIIVLAIACTVLLSISAYYQTKTACFGVYVQGIVRFNTYIGLALIATLLHQEGMTLFSIMLAICIPIVNVISVLSMTPKDKMNVVGIVKSLLKNPLILGCIVGVSFNSLNIGIWIGLESYLKLLAACSLPLGLLCIGAGLQFNGLKDDLKPLLSITFARMLCMPALGLGFACLLGLPKLETYVVVLFFALPTATASYILTKVLGGDHRLMASVISLQTLCAAVTLPIVIYWLSVFV